QAAKPVRFRPWNRPRRLVTFALAATLSLALMAAAAVAAWRARSGAPKPTEPAPPTTQADTPAPPPLASPLTGPTADPTEPSGSPEPSASSATPRISGAVQRARTAAPLRQEDLLKRANALRAARQWSESLEVYEEAMKRFPGTPEAYTAAVAAAQLRLD